MSFGLSRGKQLDTTGTGISQEDLPPLPDDLLTNPESGWLDPRDWFPDPSRPFELEIGSGKGTFLAQQAALQPDTNFLGIEWAKEFYTYAADRLRRADMPNVKLLHADASQFLQWRVPTASLTVLHLYFPDPWPKARHHKRRMVQHDFLAQAHRTLMPETPSGGGGPGELRVVTDHMDYWDWMQDHFDPWCDPNHTYNNTPMHFTRAPFTSPDSAGEGEVVGTNFERKYRREGRPFNATILRRAQ